MMKVTKKAKKAMRAVMGRIVKARKMKLRKRRRKKKAVHEAHGQRHQHQSPSRRTKRLRRVRVLDGLPVDVDAMLSMYTSATLIPRIGVYSGFDSGPCTIMETICLKAYCDNENSRENFTLYKMHRRNHK